jgi:hypothetical protein
VGTHAATLRPFHSIRTSRPASSSSFRKSRIYGRIEQERS